jgi:hypothetical protein
MQEMEASVPLDPGCCNERKYGTDAIFAGLMGS